MATLVNILQKNSGKHCPSYWQSRWSGWREEGPLNGKVHVIAPHKGFTVCLFFQVCALIFFLILFIFRQRGSEGKRGKHQSVVTSRAPPTGEPGRQPRHVSWSGNQTCDPLVFRQVLNPMSHTSQGCTLIFKNHTSCFIFSLEDPTGKFNTLFPFSLPSFYLFASPPVVNAVGDIPLEGWHPIFLVLSANGSQLHPSPENCPQST